MLTTVLPCWHTGRLSLQMNSCRYLMSINHLQSTAITLSLRFQSYENCRLYRCWEKVSEEVKATTDLQLGWKFQKMAEAWCQSWDNAHASMKPLQAMFHYQKQQHYFRQFSYLWFVLQSAEVWIGCHLPSYQIRIVTTSGLVYLEKHPKVRYYQLGHPLSFWWSYHGCHIFPPTTKAQFVCLG